MLSSQLSGLCEAESASLEIRLALLLLEIKEQFDKSTLTDEVDLCMV